MAAPSSKGKPFDFRMSKKVAELTQVVHMLFTRNHEKEVELDAIKEAYEFEIDVVIKDARSRIAKLEAHIKDLEQNRSSDDVKFKSLFEKQRKDNEEEWRRLIEGKDKEIHEGRQEMQNLRDLLINAQRDVEKLRSGMTGELGKREDDLRKKDTEIEKLRRTVGNLERKLKDETLNSSQKITDLEQKCDRLCDELSQLKEMFEDTHNVKESLLAKNKQLEHEYKTLRKELAKKIHDVVGSSKPTTPPKLLSREQNVMDYNDELERLRREIHRYKMELSNREGNFNRTFADHSKVVVDSRAGKIGMQQMQILNPHSTFPNPQSKAAPLDLQRMRERTFSYATSHVYESESDQSTRASSAVSGRFPPMLGMDQKARLSRFLKQPRLSMSRDVTS